ncbi:hypothetical protein T484DRAFT_1757272 [Baffinella frigidus]|nr:hypothetical protein T484DRAFT_1757272 [Cryptophyta sp. CCMP2293]
MTNRFTPNQQHDLHHVRWPGLLHRRHLLYGRPFGLPGSQNAPRGCTLPCADPANGKEEQPKVHSPDLQQSFATECFGETCHLEIFATECFGKTCHLEIFATEVSFLLVLRLVNKAGTPSAMCEAVVSAFAAMSRKDTVTTSGMSGVVEGLMATIVKREDATPKFLVDFNTKLLNDTVNTDCGPNCTQPGTNTRTNTECDGYWNVTNVKCPCIPLPVASDVLRSPLFTGGVFVKENKGPLPAGGTITRYQGDVIEASEFDELRKGDKRRTHAVQVGNAGRYLVPVLVSGHPVVTNYAARVRDGGSTRSNCFLWEGCNESLWLVAKEKPISAEEELLIDFGENMSDGLDDNEELDDATFVPP